jgi:hypothetical protein
MSATHAADDARPQKQTKAVRELAPSERLLERYDKVARAYAEDSASPDTPDVRLIAQAVTGASLRMRVAAQKRS